MALKMLLVRVDLAGIGFGLGVTEETVLAWLKRAAQQAEAITPLLRPLPVTQVQLDEMWNVIARTRARETDEASASRPEGEEGRQGHMRQEKVKRMSCRVLAPSPSGRGDRRCALCDKHLELNLAPMGRSLPPPRSLHVSRTRRAYLRSPCDLLRVDTLPPTPEEYGHVPDTPQPPPSRRKDGGRRAPVGSRGHLPPLWCGVSCRLSEATVCAPGHAR